MQGGGDWSRAGGSSKPAWLDVFLANQNELLAFLRRRAGPRDQPRDLLHDLFIRMSQSGAAASIEDPKAYLFRAAANVAIDAARADRFRRTEAPSPTMDDLNASDPSPAALQTTIARDRLRRMDEALAKLPEETRAMIYLLRIDGLSYDEVAAMFGISKSAVEKRVAKALRACRDQLDADDRP